MRGGRAGRRGVLQKAIFVDQQVAHLLILQPAAGGRALEHGQGGQCTGCHGSMGSYTVGATPNSAWQRLVNVPHNHGTACRNAGVPSLVVPNDKQRSLLYLKMAGLSGRY